MRWLALSSLLVVLLASTLIDAAPAPLRAQVVVLSNSSPHVTVIDGQTHQVLKTADVLQGAVWTWNDDGNYFDGKHLWLGMRNASTNDVEVVLLDLDTLQVARRIPLGKDSVGLYVGKRLRSGNLLVAKHASGQIVLIDTTTFSVVSTVNVPVDGGVACDIDVAVGFDGKERAFVATFTGNTVLSIDTTSLQVLQTLKFEGTRPFMLTASPDGRRIWVQEAAGGSNTVLSTLNLQLVERVPAGAVPITGTYSPDGKLHFTGHRGDPVVVASDAETFREVWRAQVGAGPEKLGVHPAGTFVYAALAREPVVVVLEAATGKVVTRVALGTNPTGLFVRRI